MRQNHVGSNNRIARSVVRSFGRDRILFPIVASIELYSKLESSGMNRIQGNSEQGNDK